MNEHALNVLKSIETQLNDNDLSLEERAEVLKHVSHGVKEMQKAEIVRYWQEAEAPSVLDIHTFLDDLL